MMSLRRSVSPGPQTRENAVVHGAAHVAAAGDRQPFGPAAGIWSAGGLAHMYAFAQRTHLNSARSAAAAQLTWLSNALRWILFAQPPWPARMPLRWLVRARLTSMWYLSHLLLTP